MRRKYDVSLFSNSRWDGLNRTICLSLSEFDVEEDDEGVNCEEDEEDFGPAVWQPDALATCQHGVRQKPKSQT